MRAVARSLTVAALYALLTPLGVAQQWKVQYFYDEDRSALTLEDLAFPSAQRGIAVGTIINEPSGKMKYVALLSSDSGTHWSVEAIKDHPRSLFFLNDSLGWMVTD